MYLGFLTIFGLGCCFVVELYELFVYFGKYTDSNQQGLTPRGLYLLLHGVSN